MQPSKEQISALVDDQMPQVSPALLAAIAADDPLLGAWSRYHLIGEVLRSGTEPVMLGSVDARVRQALAAEPLVLLPRSNLPRNAVREPAHRFWPALPLAASLAACGLLATYLVASSTPATRQGVPLEVALRTTTQPVLRTVSEAPRSTSSAETQAVAAQLQRRLNSYLVNFNEQREQFTLPNVHPYVRSVGFETEPPP